MTVINRQLLAFFSLRSCCLAVTIVLVQKTTVNVHSVVGVATDNLSVTARQFLLKLCTFLLYGITEGLPFCAPASIRT